MLMKRTIDRSGLMYDSMRVQTTDDLLEQLENEMWDCFVLDYDIPGFTIDQFLKILRDHDEIIPIIVVSGTMIEDQVATALQYGARDYVMKDNLRRLPAALSREIDIHHERRRYQRAQLEKIEIQDALINSEKRFKNLVENSSDIFLMLSNEGRILYVSPTVKDILGYDPEFVMNKTFFEFVYPDDKNAVYQIFVDTINDFGISPVYRYRIRHKDGSYRYIESKANNQLNDPDINAIIVNARDDSIRVESELIIQQHVRAQEKLYKSAFEYLKMSPDDDVFEYVCESLSELIPTAIITVNEYDPVTNHIYVKSICGIDQYSSFLSQFMDRFARGNAFEPSPSAIENMKKASLIRVEGGLKELSFGQIPSNIASFLEKKMKLKAIKTMGFVSGDHLHGNVVLILLGDAIPVPDQIIETFVNVATVALRKRNSDKKIIESLHEKEVMLKEIHHRVKNNLQIISSLLELQSLKIKDDETRHIFMDSQSRVKSMALVHEKIYQSEDLSSINYKEYIDQLAEYLFTSYDLPNVRYSIESEDINMPIDSAIPAGIIINELISNSLKHAFPDGRDGQISITLKNECDFVVLMVSDNGVGMKSDTRLEKSTSLGLELVHALTQQLHANVKLDCSKGTKYTFEIPVYIHNNKNGKSQTD